MPEPQDVSLRPVQDDDWPFLEALYASTRHDELAQVPWSDTEKAEFLRGQFAAQRQHYAQHYADASCQIVSAAGERIGRLYLDRRPDEIRIVDIALLPTHRGRGIGSRLLRDVLAEARESARAVRIHVEAFNPAMRLYERLGFRKVDERGVYWLMAFTPPQKEQGRDVQDADS